MKIIYTLILSLFLWNISTAQSLTCIVEFENHDENNPAVGSFYFNSNPSQKFTFTANANGRIETELVVPDSSGLIYFEFEDCTNTIISDNRFYFTDSLENAVFVFDYCPDSTSTYSIEVVVELENFPENTIANGSFYYQYDLSNKYTYDFSSTGRISTVLQTSEKEDIIWFEFEDCTSAIIRDFQSYNLDSAGKYVFVLDYCEFGPSCDARFEIEQAMKNDSSMLPGEVIVYDVSTPQSEIASWYWDFGDGETSIDPTPMHSYSDEGPYLLCLTIVTYDSCISTYCDTLEVDSSGIVRNGFNITVINDGFGSTALTDSDNQEISISPNPVSIHATLYFSQAVTAELKVFSISGNLVGTKKLNNAQFVSLSDFDLHQGMYILNVNDRSFKVVVTE